MNAILRTTALVATFSLAATACGGGDATTESTGAAAPEAQNAAATTGADEVDRTGWPDKLVFAAVPAEESSSLQQRYQHHMTLIEEATGLPVEFEQATSYAGVIEGMIAGRVDLAQFGPFSYVIASTAGAKIRPIGAMVDAPDAEPGYQSLGITRADNDEINSLEDFAGRDVCFVDPGSTSGFLYPSAGLLEVGIDPETGVNGTFAGGHDASALAVARGDCEAGFAFDDMVHVRLIESGDLQDGELKVVWESETIAGSPLAVNTELPESLLEILDEVIIEQANVDHLVAAGMCADVDGCELSDEEIWGYKVVQDDFYDGVRAVCDLTKSAQCDPANA